MFFTFYYRQDLPQAALPVLFLLTGLFLGFSPRRGDTLHVAPIKVKFVMEQRTIGPLFHAKFHLDRSRGGGLRPQKLKKISNFTKGRVPCMIFIKFISFMRVLSLHNSAKFGCFVSINNKIINNLLRWRRFQPNFRRPLAGKLWMGPKNV